MLHLCSQLVGAQPGDSPDSSVVDVGEAVVREMVAQLIAVRPGLSTPNGRPIAAV